MESLTGALLAIPLFAVAASAQPADTLLVNGKILAVDQAFSTREALAIRDGRIVALGGNPEMRRLAGPQTRVIDLEGRTAIPGNATFTSSRICSTAPILTCEGNNRRSCSACT